MCWGIFLLSRSWSPRITYVAIVFRGTMQMSICSWSRMSRDVQHGHSRRPISKYFYTSPPYYVDNAIIECQFLITFYGPRSEYLRRLSRFPRRLERSTIGASAHWWEGKEERGTRTCHVFTSMAVLYSSVTA